MTTFQNDTRMGFHSKVLVTGGLGCIGLAITSALLNRHPNAQIHILDLRIPDPEDDGKFNAQVKQYHKVDITDSVAVLNLFRLVKPQIVIHTAGLIPGAAKALGLGDEGLVKVNVGGTKNVLDAAVEAGTEMFVLTSSCDVIKRSYSMDMINVSEKDDDLDSNMGWEDKYSETKAEAERIVRSAAVNSPTSRSQSSIKTCAIRTHGVIGKHDNNIVPLFAQLPRRINIGPGTNLYDFTGVDNLALAHVLAVENLLGSATANGKAFFVTDAHPRPMRQVLEMVWTELDSSERVKKAQSMASAEDHYPFWIIPVWFVRGVAMSTNFLLRALGKDGLLSVGEINDGICQRYFNNTRAKEILGYVPSVPLEQSIKDACNSYKERLGVASS
jgi:sterol-4alpha-carboxylate 3-dehydrogenase (decarboxylating)